MNNTRNSINQDVWRQYHHATSDAVAASLCVKATREWLKGYLKTHESKGLAASSILISFKHGKLQHLVTRKNESKAFNKVRRLMRTVESGVKMVTNMPLFDSAIFSEISAQTSQILFAPEIMSKILAYGDVELAHNIDSLAQDFQKQRGIGKNPHIIGNAYFQLLAADTLVDAKHKMDHALQLIYKNNAPLIYAIAKDYKGKGLTWDELVSAGNFGMMRAVQRYSLGLGASFATHASPWIKQMIVEEFKSRSLITLAYRDAPKVHQIYKSISSGEATLAEAALQQGLEESVAAELLAVYEGPLSLDFSTETDGDEGRNLHEMVGMSASPDDLIETPMSILENIITEVLDQNEALIIKCSFGIYDMSLKDAAAQLGVDPRMVSSIRTAALGTLRQALEAQGLDVNDMIA